MYIYIYMYSYRCSLLAIPYWLFPTPGAWATVYVLSDTLWTWKWSPAPCMYISLRAPKGPGSGPPPSKCYPR